MRIFNAACLIGRFYFWLDFNWLFYFIRLDNPEVQTYLYYLINELPSAADCSCNYPGINGNSPLLWGA